MKNPAKENNSDFPVGAESNLESPAILMLSLSLLFLLPEGVFKSMGTGISENTHTTIRTHVILVPNGINSFLIT